MSLAAESPSPSPSPSPSMSSLSDSEDFADLLAAELELADSASHGDPSASPASDDEEEDMAVEIDAVEQGSAKRRRVEERHQDQKTAVMPDEDAIGSFKDAQIKICPPHPGFFGGLCIKCGKDQDEEDVPGVAFGYIHKGLSLDTSEMDRLRGSEVKNLLRKRKLVLILDLDHTLINSTRFHDISPAEMDLGIQSVASKDVPNKSMFNLQGIHMLTKLRPFVRKFLEEASNMFEMYIYTMGDKAYAIEIAKLLDPGNIYFGSKVISNSDCTQRHQKGLDVVLGAESTAVILDDTEHVWQKHKENLILMERYHYFASSCRQFGFSDKSLSELVQDERESDGALATILHVLKRVHESFFDSGVETALSSRDVRQVIKRVRQEVLQGCKLVFTRVFRSDWRPQDQVLWKMAEQLGAVCCSEVDSTVTHVVALHSGTKKARWAVGNNKFLLHPRWIEACNYRWSRLPEEGFPVPVSKEKGKENRWSRLPEEGFPVPVSKEKGKEKVAEDADLTRRV